MNGIVKGILTALLSLCLIGYVGYQAYHALYRPVTTERVYSGTVRDTITAESFVLHNEQIVTANTGSGVVDYTREDGERVSVGGTVARVYSNAQDAANARLAAQLDSEIAALSASGDGANATSADVTTLNTQINDSLRELADQVDSSQLDSLTDMRGQLLRMLNQKQLATGEAQNFSSRIAQLQQQKNALGKAAGHVQSIAAPVSGYFVSSTDGYEGMYDTDKIQTVTTADIQKLESAKPQPQSGAIGKVVSDFQWYIVCKVGETDARKLKVGQSVHAQFLLSSAGEVPVTVEAINRCSDGYAVALECGTMTDKLSVIRKQNIQIIASEITGVKVPNSMIHVVNNTPGVYVLEGNTIVFRKIQPQYTGNGYTVSAVDPSDDSLLQVYDEAVVNGDNLYDGKVVK